jgi:hypothetical protein
VIGANIWFLRACSITSASARVSPNRASPNNVAEALAVAKEISRNHTVIRFADDLIDEATKRIAAIERALEALQRRRRRWSTLAPAAQMELREQIDYVQARREIAELELLELIELAELPIEFMGSA